MWLLAGVLLGLSLWAEHDRIEARERTLLAQQATVLHDNLGAQLEAISRTLDRLRDQMPQRPGRGGSDARFSGHLRIVADATPAVRGLHLLDASGRVYASSDARFLERELGQRDYFQAALGATSDQLIVARPSRGTFGDWVMVLGRSLRSPDGEFGGMLMAALKVHDFQTLLQSVRYAPDTRVSLNHGDGQSYMILGADADAEEVNLAQPDTAFTRHMATGDDASVQHGAPLPGYPDYILALRTVQPPMLHMDRPLVVGVGRPDQGIYRDWSAQAWAKLLVYVLVGLVVAWGLQWMQGRQDYLRDQARQLHAAQRERQEAQRRLAENLPGVVYQFQREPDGRCHYPYASPGVVDIYGVTPEQLSQDAAPALACTHPDDLPQRIKDIEESARTLRDWKSEYRVVLPERGERWISGQSRPQRLESGAVLWHGYIHDVTDIKRQALQLQETERLLQQLMNDMPVGLCMVDAQQRIYFRNRRFIEHFGYTEADVPSLHEWALHAYPDADYRQEVARLWGQAMTHARSRTGVIEAHSYRVTARNGTPHVMDIGGLLFGEHFLATFQDRTEQQAQSELLHRLAYVDGLTGIANRRKFDQALQAEWRRCRRSRKPLSVMLLDIDYFKQYNDHYGHQAGDACLQSVAKVLGDALARSHDLVARYGGEEFVCLLPECDAAGALYKARQLCRAVQALGLEHAGSKVAGTVTASIGVACQVPGGDNGPEALLQQADMHLYQAKAQGRNRAVGEVLARHGQGLGVH